MLYQLFFFSIKVGKNAFFREIVEPVATIAALIPTIVRPSSWSAPVFLALRNQILFAGLQECLLIAVLGAATGVSLALFQMQAFVPILFGRPDEPADFLVIIVATIYSPFIVNLIIIARSGSAITALIATMRVNGEIRVLEAQGIDPLGYILLPRFVGLNIAALMLVVLFSSFLFITSYLTQWYYNVTLVGPTLYALNILGLLQPFHYLQVFLATCIPASLTALLCVVQGFRGSCAFTEIPRSTASGVGRALIALFFCSTLLSIYVMTRNHTY